MTKTNVMRLLEAAGIAYRTAEYEYDEANLSGLHAAEQVGMDAEQVFKTLVTKGASGVYYVFDIPVAESLDLKKAAKAVGEKSIEMVHVKEINGLTGYVRGGCSPVGMKKQYPTVFHETATAGEIIMVSAGKIGYQIACAPGDLISLVRGTTADLV